MSNDHGYPHPDDVTPEIQALIDADTAMGARRLDDWLCRHLLGWTRRYVGGKEGIRLTGDVVNACLWFKPDGGWTYDAPKLSTTYEGMGMVLEAMRKLKWRVVLRGGLDGSAEAEFWLQSGTWPSASVEAEGDSDPRAVALAAKTALANALKKEG